MPAISTIIIASAAYLVGAIPSGYLIARSKGINIAQHGSGNVGATNVGRILGKQAGVYTLIADVLKGYLAVLVAILAGSSTLDSAAASLAVVMGHCFSIPGKLKGGKGVATALGVILLLSPESAAVCLAAFGLVLAASKIVSVASICAVLVGPVCAIFFDLSEWHQYALMAIALLVVSKHRANLKRLVEGKEPRLGQKAAA